MDNMTMARSTATAGSEGRMKEDISSKRSKARNRNLVNLLMNKRSSVREGKIGKGVKAALTTGTRTLKDSANKFPQKGKKISDRYNAIMSKSK